MKKYFVCCIICLFFIGASNLFATESKDFATKGILEFGGGISASNTIYRDSDTQKSRLSVGINPILDYYFIDNIHIGLVPVFRFMSSTRKDDSDLDYKFISIGPELSIGYTFRLSESLFFDFSPFGGYNYGKTYYKDSSFNDTDKSYDFGLDLSLKYKIGNILLNTTLRPEYTDYITDNDTFEDNNYNVSLSFGISAFI